ncbi:MULTISPECIES: CD1871A family CXXC motif-containing protein [Peptoniphilus]|uniref:CD1871A family CXXC motif-containing protein n=1 Tax=Peptoniphilus hominis (ex Hitch et al. 2025) TaxID=3133174 RepID=A0ABV1CI01_9FIRM|nr:CD1871A family CXXC motif-containing protein [Peptoniphilus sp. HMSC062D09]
MKEFVNRKFSYAMLILSIAFIFWGAYRSEVDTVLSKAIRICLECVGIG